MFEDNMATLNQNQNRCSVISCRSITFSVFVCFCLSVTRWMKRVTSCPAGWFPPRGDVCYRRCRSLSLEAQNPRHPNQTSVFTVLKYWTRVSSPLLSVPSVCFSSFVFEVVNLRLRLKLVRLSQSFTAAKTKSGLMVNIGTGPMFLLSVF